MWQELTPNNLQGLAVYANVVLNFFASDEYYEQASNEFLANEITRKGGDLRYFLYDDGTKQMSFGVKFSPQMKEGMWKVIDLSYLGEWGKVDDFGVSKEALDFGLAEITAWMDRENITKVYSVFNKETIDIPEKRYVFLEFLSQAREKAKEFFIEEKSEQIDPTHFVYYYSRK